MLNAWIHLWTGLSFTCLPLIWVLRPFRALDLTSKHIYLGPWPFLEQLLVPPPDHLSKIAEPFLLPPRPDQGSPPHPCFADCEGCSSFSSPSPLEPKWLQTSLSWKKTSNLLWVNSQHATNILSAKLPAVVLFTFGCSPANGQTLQFWGTFWGVTHSSLKDLRLPPWVNWLNKLITVNPLSKICGI